MDTTKRHVMQCQSGDRDAFGYLYSLHAPAMTKVIEGLIPNHAVAQDILHDGFIVAFVSIANLRNPDKFEAWLTTIMRNLSLQYLREAANHISVPISDTPGSNLFNEETPEPDLSWEELDRIIDRLPAGYNKVFRLAVLDGLSHKEIGAMLGIAPHSSSSQLSHAKAMLRRLITEHRIGIGVICVSAIIISIVMFRSGIERKSEPDAVKRIIADESDRTDRRKDTKERQRPPAEDTVMPSARIRHETVNAAKEHIAERQLPADTSLVVPENEGYKDTVSDSPEIPFFGRGDEFLTSNDTPATDKEGNQNRWSFSVVYSGYAGQNTDNRYRIPIGSEPDLPSGEPEMIDVTEKHRHYMPVVVGISLNRNLSDRWSVESGIRYTFLRSHYMRESILATTETDQQIHYIGIPLKFNCRIFGNTRFSLYGQGGAALDIPVYGTQSVMNREQGWDKPTYDHLRISAPLQWSVEAGLGFQYHITPSFSIYAEPSFRYYFNPGTEIKTIRQDKPFEFTIPIGIRLNW